MLVTVLDTSPGKIGGVDRLWINATLSQPGIGLTRGLCRLGQVAVIAVPTCLVPCFGLLGAGPLWGQSVNGLALHNPRIKPCQV